MMTMCPWRLIALMIGLCASVRISLDDEIHGQHGLAAKTGECPTLVQEFSDLSCRDADGSQVDASCCNLLKTCRFESTALLGYYLDWNSVYEQDCSVDFTDFDFSANMLSLVYVGDDTKVCGEGCQASS